MSSPAAPSVRHWQIVGGSAAAQPITGGAHEAWTLIGSEDTTIELVLDDDYAIILKVGNTGQMSASGDYQLQYEVNGTGGFADVNATSSNLRSAASGDTDAATSTTEQLGTSAQTFQNSVLDEVDGLVGTNVGGGDEYEFFYTFNLRGAELTAGAESIELRLTTGGSTFDHTAVEPILITLPALSVPPAAFIPVPKANWVEASRKLQALELNEYPQKPPPVSVVAETPALKANRVEAERQIQTLPRLPEYPLPAVPPVPYPSWLPPLAIVSRFDRDRQKLPQLDQWTPTPPGFRWPKPPMPTLTVEFVRTRRDLPQLDERPPTPAGFFEGFFPAPFRVKRIPTTYGREAQRVLNPHVYPETPLGFFEGQWPSHKPPPVFRISFTRVIQPVLIPPEYPAPPVPPVSVVAETPALKANRVEFNRALQAPLELNEHPPTPAAVSASRSPQDARAFVTFNIRSRQFQQATPVTEFPEPPIAVEDYGGYTPVTKFSWSAKRVLQSLGNPHVYPATPPGFRWPRPPMPTLTTAFARRLQSLPQLDERPPTPPPAPPQPAVKANRVSFTRHRRALNHNPAYPPTPAGFFDGFWPGSRRVTPLHSAFERHLATLPQHDEWAQIPPVPLVTSWTRALESYTTDFDRVALTWPVHNEYPETPPSIIEGMAMWPAMPIYRRDIHRTLQPVWNPSATVPPLFIPGLAICWRADPMEIVWTAGGKENTWTADSTDTGWEASCTDTTWEADCADTTWIADPFCD